MKKYFGKFLLCISIILIGLGISSYFFGSDIFGLEKVVNFVESQNSTSVLKIEDNQYDADEGFYYSNLNDDEKDVYDQIYSRAKNQQTVIKIRSNLDAQKIIKVASFVECEHPELFWLNSQYSIDTSNILTLGSSYGKDEIASLSIQIKNATDEILKNLNDNMSDYDKSLYLYDYIIENTTYSKKAIDKTAEYPWASSLVGPLTMGKSTCMGYAKAYQYLLQLSKISCAVVLGNAETPQGKGAHAWVIQKCDGACYYTDPTWGDCFEQNETQDFVCHAYFCASENDIEKTHSIENKDILPKCTSNADNYFVKESRYYTTYDRSQIRKLIKNDAQNGKYYIELKFSSKDVYDNALKKLIDDGQIYHILTLESLTNKEIDNNNIKYSENKDLYIISVFFKKANNG